MIVISIIGILGVIMVSSFGSVGVFNKARDAQRKKDLGRIKIAFEEYFNDKGCYPDSATVAKLNLATNCNSSVFSPWISNWPCDPDKKAYPVVVEDAWVSNCSRWYKVFANLENTMDHDIPSSLKNDSSIMLGSGITSKNVNFGISSQNINWSDKWTDPECAATGGCYWFTDPGVCNSAGTGCVGPNCYKGFSHGTTCHSNCQVACCGAGCN